ncbi:MAG: HAD family phosphatase [Spirochaetaceae bacterium]|jgi:putative hydrolase of the HAD superfamily|nr:HAD family phosphatase [Spirochaetaceae bacterium]
MIKNIVFDMGNVLAKFDAALFCASRAENPRDAELLRSAVFSSVEWAQLDRGVISGEKAVKAMEERLPKRLRGQAAWLVEHWYDHFKPDRAMEKFIGGLKEKGYGIYLLSNAGFDFYNFKPSLGALKYFDGGLISAEVHLLKPDKEIFLSLLKKYSLKSGECFFVDDMSANVEAALNLGFKGMVYTGRVRDLALALSRAGVC